MSYAIQIKFIEETNAECRLYADFGGVLAVCKVAWDILERRNVEKIHFSGRSVDWVKVYHMNDDSGISKTSIDSKLSESELLGIIKNRIGYKKPNEETRVKFLNLYAIQRGYKGWDELLRDNLIPKFLLSEQDMDIWE